MRKMKLNFSGRWHRTAALALVGVATSSISVAQTITPDSERVDHSTSLADIIQGEVAGISVSKIDGQVGAAYEFMLRGINSIRGNQQPLILVDGVAINADMQSEANPWSLNYPYNNQTGVSDSGKDNLYKKLVADDYQMPINLLAGLDISIIESIEILKNNSATAIYGSRGANGVILIKTFSKGTSNRKISLSTSLGVVSVTDRLDLLSPEEYMSYHKELNGYNYITRDAASIDWQDELFAPSISSTTRLEIAGNEKDARYALNLMYNNEGGAIANSGQEQLSLNAMFSRKINSIFEFGTRVSLSRSNLDLTKSTALIGMASATKLVNAVPYENAELNPAAYAANYEDNALLYRIMPTAYLAAKFNQTFSLRVEGGVDVLLERRNKWAGYGTDMGNELDGIASVADTERVNYDVSAIFRADILRQDAHKLNMQIGGFYYGDTASQSTTQGYEFFNHSLRSDGVRLAAVSSKMFYLNQGVANYGALASLDYTLLDRYTIKAGARADVAIGVDSEPTYYPYAQAEWRVSNEAWYGAGLQSVVSKFALRAGWGVSGNREFTPYFLGSYYSMSSDVANIPYTEQLDYTMGLFTINESYDAGFDASLFGNAVNLSAIAYKGQVEDKMSVYNSTTAPYATVLSNGMKMDKWGVEVAISATPVKNSTWRWDVGANLGLDRVELTQSAVDVMLASTGGAGFTGRDLGAGNTASAFVAGYAPAAFFGYKTDGIVGEEHLWLTPPFNGERLGVGDVKFVDVNGDKQTDAEDMVIIGSPLPDFVASFNTRLSYKRFALSMRLDGSYGNDVLNLNLLEQANLASNNNPLSKYYNNAFSEKNPTHTSPSVGAVGYDVISDRQVEDGSYVKLSDLVFSYTLPMAKSSVISGIEFSLMARNLCMISGYSGYSPEVNSFGGDWSTRGIDLGAYPYAKSISLGVKLNF